LGLLGFEVHHSGRTVVEIGFGCCAVVFVNRRTFLRFVICRWVNLIDGFKVVGRLRRLGCLVLGVGFEFFIVGTLFFRARAASILAANFFFSVAVIAGNLLFSAFLVKVS